MKAYDAASYVLTENCKFVKEAAAAFMAVHVATQGKVCDTGCGNFNGGKCIGFQKLTRPYIAPKVQTETVRAEALRLGITIAEVRRKRRG